MQRPNEKKRRLIAATAARLFASRPFHKVKLDDVAAAAGVGKGTLYIYFKSKEDLYFWLIYDAFSRVVEQLESQLQGGGFTAAQALRRIIAELVKFGFDNPQLYELMRTAGPIIKDDRWDHKRKELASLIEQTIRRGIQSGEFRDPHPEITALCVPGLLRSVMLFGPKGLNEKTVAAQITRLLEQGICPPDDVRGKAKPSKRNNGKLRKPTVAVATRKNHR
jgi:AcrR family transcriptional regulator